MKTEKKNPIIEKAEMEIAKRLHDKPWYSDAGGCLAKAQEILFIPEIAVVDRKTELPPIAGTDNDYFSGRMMERRYMLKLGYVKEVKI